MKTFKQFRKLAEGAAWTRSAGKNKSGGLNEKGRKSYERENPGSDLKAPSKEVGNPRRASFCARMKGMKSKLTSAKTARDPDSRINKSLRAWNCWCLSHQTRGRKVLLEDKRTPNRIRGMLLLRKQRMAARKNDPSNLGITFYSNSHGTRTSSSLHENVWQNSYSWC